ncbi:unnamed protein product, partial [Linum tenue]
MCHLTWIKLALHKELSYSKRIVKVIMEQSVQLQMVVGKEQVKVEGTLDNYLQLYGNQKKMKITCNSLQISITSAIGAQSPKFLSTNWFPPPRALKKSIP